MPDQHDPNFSPLIDFLSACENAAKPVPQLPVNALMAYGGAVVALSGVAQDGFIRTFGDMGISAGGTVSDAVLPENRPERIGVLLKWMAGFEAHKWLSRQPSVTSALESFRRIKRRERESNRFRDDLADFRFWKCAALAAQFRDFQALPSANAEERKSAEKSVRRLRQLCDSTRLLQDVGLSYFQREEFRKSLSVILAIGKISKRPRHDAHSADREYIDLLVLLCLGEFDMAPPSIIVSLAGLKLRSPDSVSITKLVAAETRRLRATEAWHKRV